MGQKVIKRKFRSGFRLSEDSTHRCSNERRYDVCSQRGGTLRRADTASCRLFYDTGMPFHATSL